MTKIFSDKSLANSADTKWHGSLSNAGKNLNPNHYYNPNPNSNTKCNHRY